RHMVIKKAVPVWPFVAAGAIVVAGGVTLTVFLTQSSAQDTSQAPKEEIVVVERAPAKAEGAKDDARKESNAAALFTNADHLMKESKWAEALAELQKLQKEYPALQYTIKHSTEMGEKIGSCTSELRKMESARTKQIE